MKLLVGILALAAATVAVVPHGNKAQTRYQTGGIVALTHFNMATFYHDGSTQQERPFHLSSLPRSRACVCLSCVCRFAFFSLC